MSKMIRNRLYPMLMTTAALICLALIRQDCMGSDEQQPSTPPAPSSVLSNIPSAEAKQHIGQTNTVCGLVATARFLESAKGKPTFLNFDRPYPDHTFTVAIFESDRAKFSSPPETLFEGKTVCVTGRIVDYKGTPEIVVKEPSQIVIQEAAPATAGGTSTNSSRKSQSTPAPH